MCSRGYVFFVKFAKVRKISLNSTVSLYSALSSVIPGLGGMRVAVDMLQIKLGRSRGSYIFNFSWIYLCIDLCIHLWIFSGTSKYT